MKPIYGTIEHEQKPHRFGADARAPLDAGIIGSGPAKRSAGWRSGARIVLAAADGQTTVEIARAQHLRPATVSKWRVRFSIAGLSGLQGAPRLGAARRYDESTERRILAKLDEAPPSGYATWTGSLVAEALGDVSNHQVWRVLRGEGIQLQRRRSWCI